MGGEGEVERLRVNYFRDYTACIKITNSFIQFQPIDNMSTKDDTIHHRATNMEKKVTRNPIDSGNHMGSNGAIHAKRDLNYGGSRNPTDGYANDDELTMCLECCASLEVCVCVCMFCGERDKCECALFDAATGG